MSDPKDMTPIRVENLGNLSIDGKNQLYWKKERIHTESLLGLSYWQKNLITLFTFFAAVATIANAVASWTNYLTRKSSSVVVNPNVYIPAPPALPPSLPAGSNPAAQTKHRPPAHTAHP